MPDERPMTTAGRLTYAGVRIRSGRSWSLSQAYAEAVGRLRPAAGEAGRMTVERAAGLLAGRTRCRVAEAHRHLLRMAADQRRDLIEVAAGVVHLLDVQDDDVPVRPFSATELIDAAMAAPAAPISPAPAPSAPLRRFEPWLAMVQTVLDVSP